MSGKWHLGKDPNDAGFEFYTYFEGNGTYYGRTIFDMGEKLNPEIHCDEYCVSRSIYFLKEAINRDRPFFLFHNTKLPHMNGKLKWDAKPETLAKYNADDMPVVTTNHENLLGKPEYLKNVRNLKQAKKYGYPDEKAIQQHTKAYYSVITEMDYFLGRLFATIEELGLRENTYIFFMSDNGWMLGEHGFTSKVLPYKPSTQVPFFVVGPGIQKGNNASLILNIDMAPTILELAGVEVPRNLHGESFALMLKQQKTKNWRKAFVYEGLGLYGGAKPNLAALSSKYRYIETYDDESLQTLIFRELYDQLNDPDEMNNQVDNPALQPEIEKLKKVVKSHKEEILHIDNQIF